MQRYKIEGMTCGHCAKTVTQALEALPQVERALVDLERGEVTIEGAVAEETVRQSVDEAGYAVIKRLPAA